MIHTVLDPVSQQHSTLAISFGGLRLKIDPFVSWPTAKRTRCQREFKGLGSRCKQTVTESSARPPCVDSSPSSMVHPLLSHLSAFLRILGIPDLDARMVVEDDLREPYGDNPAARHVGRSSHLGLVSHEYAQHSEISGIAGGCKIIRVPNAACPLASWTHILRSDGCCYLD